MSFFKRKMKDKPQTLELPILNYQQGDVLIVSTSTCLSKEMAERIKNQWDKRMNPSERKPSLLVFEGLKDLKFHILRDSPFIPPGPPPKKYAQRI